VKYVEAGFVYLPKEAPWLSTFIEEHAAFPNGTHDDIVDTTSMGLARLFTGYTRRDAAEIRYNPREGARRVGTWREQMRARRREVAEDYYKQAEEAAEKRKRERRHS